jgi:hypothetical protein
LSQISIAQIAENFSLSQPWVRCYCYEPLTE